MRAHYSLNRRVPGPPVLTGPRPFSVFKLVSQQVLAGPVILPLFVRKLFSSLSVSLSLSVTFSSPGPAILDFSWFL